jgi:serine/threonine-protein kinase
MGGTWGLDDIITFSHCTYGLRRISAAGGVPEVITDVTEIQAEAQHQYPQLLPDGEVVLFTIWNNTEDARIAVRNLVTNEQRTVIEPGTHARYVPTGHLVYAWAGELLAVPFDLERLEVTGLPVRVLESVLMEEDRGAAYFSFSENGSLVYIPGGLVRNPNELVWVDRTGKIEPFPFPLPEYGPRVSPDGNQVLVNRPGVRGSALDIWVYELERGVERRLTDKGNEFWPVWTPDGRRVVYNSLREGRLNLYWKPVDGSGQEEILFESDNWLSPFSCRPDGKLLAFTENHPDNGFDIWLLPLEDDREPRSFLRTRHDEFHPTFSPDGQWMAYVSAESGRWEVNVRRYPGPGGVTQISTEGGLEPIWSPDGREIYYRSLEGNRVMAASFLPEEPSPRVGKPQLLFEGRFLGGPRWGRRYDLAPDGERFLMVQEGEPPPPPTQYNIVLNWFEELKRLVPGEVD